MANVADVPNLVNLRSNSKLQQLQISEVFSKVNGKGLGVLVKPDTKTKAVRAVVHRDDGFFVALGQQTSTLEIRSNDDYLAFEERLRQDGIEILNVLVNNASKEHGIVLTYRIIPEAERQSVPAPVR